jgi:ferredoxin
MHMPTGHLPNSGATSQPCLSSRTVADGSANESHPSPHTPADKLLDFLRSGGCPASDDLDDYCGDFRSFVSLNGIETADMRYQRERQPGRPAEAPEPKEPQASVSDAHPDALDRPDRSPAANQPWVALQADRCAHRHARCEGCRRCIESCIYGAIHTGGDIPHIDHSACRACAACVTACPSGAMQWLPLSMAALLTRLKSSLTSFLKDRHRPPIVVFHSQGTGIPVTAPALIDFEVTPIGLIGMETLLTAMAFGAAGAYILTEHTADDRVDRRLAEEVQWCRTLITTFGLAENSIGMFDPASAHCCFPDAADALRIPPATYALDQTKQASIRQAARHLARYGRNPATSVPFPDGAPFGAVCIDGSRCTLCMACAGACKMKALSPMDGDAPGLQFVEKNCVQCGLCAQVCPEKAVTLLPRLNLNDTAAKLHWSEPARCISCGRPFASRQMIVSIQRKLQGHWMYGDAEAMERLRMCDRCRVQHLFSTPKRRA